MKMTYAETRRTGVRARFVIYGGQACPAIRSEIDEAAMSFETKEAHQSPHNVMSMTICWGVKKSSKVHDEFG